MGPALWPLANVEVVTPQLTLNYVSDDLGEELALLAARGVHDPATMPFATLPYIETGTTCRRRRNRDDTVVEFSMARSRWETIRRNDIQLRGIDAACAQLQIVRSCLA